VNFNILKIIMTSNVTATVTNAAASRHCIAQHRTDVKIRYQWHWDKLL